MYRGATSLQHHVVNDVQFQTADVEVALNQQVQHATKVSAQLEKRLFALQAELQQCRDSHRGAQSVLADVRHSRDMMTPRSATTSSSTPRRRFPTAEPPSPQRAREGLDGAIQAVGAAVSSLAALTQEMETLESRLSIQIRWIRDLIRRDNECLTSVGCRKQQAKQYRHAGGVQLTDEMSATDWPTQANEAFLEAGSVMKRSTDARHSVFEVCKHAQLMAARAKKASMDAIAESVSSRLEQRHALECELETLAKKRYDTAKTLEFTRAQLTSLRDPLKVTLARQSARHDTDDDVGRALRSEKAAVIRGYRQLRHLTRQLETDVTGMNNEEATVRSEMRDLERELAADREAMMSENALRVTLAPQPPTRRTIRTFAHEQQTGNPISWDPSAASPRELPFSLWNNLTATQYPGQRRDPKSLSPREKKKRIQEQRAAATASRRPSYIPKPPPKTAR